MNFTRFLFCRLHTTFNGFLCLLNTNFLYDVVDSWKDYRESFHFAITIPEAKLRLVLSQTSHHVEYNELLFNKNLLRVFLCHLITVANWTTTIEWCHWINQTVTLSADYTSSWMTSRSRKSFQATDVIDVLAFRISSSLTSVSNGCASPQSAREGKGSMLRKWLVDRLAWLGTEFSLRSLQVSHEDNQPELIRRKRCSKSLIGNVLWCATKAESQQQTEKSESFPFTFPIYFLLHIF